MLSHISCIFLSCAFAHSSHSLIIWSRSSLSLSPDFLYLLDSFYLQCSLLNFLVELLDFSIQSSFPIESYLFIEFLSLGTLYTVKNRVCTVWACLMLHLSKILRVIQSICPFLSVWKCQQVILISFCELFSNLISHTSREQ